ncbi:hypothetical protein ACIOKD_03785 [Streptomyces sp. NPDC087844]|uniref:hypothetical protein n=1 Tax=Streptomyces sp. NPDC087844 TaxID=3365805 RepID=UPI003805FD39
MTSPPDIPTNIPSSSSADTVPGDGPSRTPHALSPGLVPALAVAPRTIVVDEHTARVGEVMGCEGPYLQLRPLGGGREWDADPAQVRPASAQERLRASVAAANARSRSAPLGPG